MEHLSGSNDEATPTVSNMAEEYDSEGALIFTVAVLVLYGSSIMAFIAYSVRSSRSTSNSSQEDVEIVRFLSAHDDVGRDLARAEVSCLAEINTLSKVNG
ncbi:hypothetical protein EB796_010295 [Bugula neritina]|uniref:Uncharacterized protein n=1 Tax=Bugula neritina TaxID=10212 RepID=A0A7J7JYE0_BUGNE|nr:hypothetical protein EB796_010296 [Bugula neritina]KAF6031429.1 hypothetical protein EB796_010295 [Bugula neritina]